MAEHDKILILDFGSQYSHLIARRVREHNVYSELRQGTIAAEEIKAFNPKGIILSGGPGSVYEEGAPKPAQEIWDLGVPILGICYGQQLITQQLGGTVESGSEREYGRATLRLLRTGEVLQGMPQESTVWMSHGDRVVKAPPGFRVLATSQNAPFAAIGDTERNIFGLQFHPEVTHTRFGKVIFERFLIGRCRCKRDWQMGPFAQEAIGRIRHQVGKGRLLGAVSGGVDSTVAAALSAKAVGNRFTGIFVDNGLLRKNEGEKVIQRLRDHLNVNLIPVDASDRFLDALKGVTDPEEKRKIIGHTFIHVFEEEAKKIGDVGYLLQGTLYPDVIESVSHKGPSATIKSHHNVGGLLDNMKLSLVEPLRELFKDEVRKLGRELCIEETLIARHPFPGPGLAVRCLGDLTRERLEVLRNADEIYIDEIRKAGLYDDIAQAFAVLLPCRSVGVMGDSRTYEEVVVLRAVTSTDFMTADWYPMPYDVLQTCSNRIINEVRGVNRVSYDVSSKPPATVEWE